MIAQHTRRRARLGAGVLAAAAGLTGCQPLAITALGAGASAGISHSINGVATRTFAAPVEQVHGAIEAALRRLGMRYETVTEKARLVMVRAEAGQARTVEIQYQELTHTATQVAVAVKTGSLVYDRATADEILLQAERQLSAKAAP